MRRVRGDRQILNIISVDIRLQIGAFSLRGRARPVSGDKKGTSAEGKNIDISGEISIRIDMYRYFCHHYVIKQTWFQLDRAVPLTTYLFIEFLKQKFGNHLIVWHAAFF